jgi:aryl-alcohol dehydrogenase-like predicted oxidoreductase
MKILSVLDTLALKYNTEPAGIAIAWLIARPSVTAPIASATSLPQLKVLTEAAAIQLKKEDVEILNEVSEWR